MSLRSTVAGWLAAGARKVLGYLDAAEQWSRDRSRIPGFVQDDRFDVTTASRLEVLRKARNLFSNNAIVTRLCFLFEQFTVGSNGLVFTPASSDPEWNTAAAADWAMFAKFCDVSSRQSLGSFASQTACRWFADGEAFILLTNAGPAGGFMPRIQLIEAHRVETPPKMWAREGISIHAGIEVSREGRPIRYWVRDSFDGDSFSPIPASDIIHVFEPDRPGQLRGLPAITPVIKDLQDLDDLQMLQMRAAKKAASVAAVMKQNRGQMSQGLMKTSRYAADGTTSTGAATSEQRATYVQSVIGGETVFLDPGEELVQPTAIRPSAEERELWYYLARKICAGVSIPSLFVFPEATQGTVTRADLDIANAHFKSRSSVLIAAFTRIYEWYMEARIRQNAALSVPPSDWRSVKVRPPRGPNVDVGRNSAALIAEFKAGWRTMESICSELGDDWRTVMRQKATEMAEAHALAEEFDLDATEIIETAITDVLEEPDPANPEQPTPPRRRSASSMALCS